MGVIVPQVPQLIVAEGLQYVTFKGITFSHDNWFPGPEGLGDFQGGPRVPGATPRCNPTAVQAYLTRERGRNVRPELHHRRSPDDAGHTTFTLMTSRPATLCLAPWLSLAPA